jgi:hypothetical protein
MRVVQPRDTGVIELCERALLDHEALPAGGRKPRVAKDLDRDLASEIRTLREVDDAHPAFAEQLLQAVGIELGRVEGRRAGGRSHDIVREERDSAVQDRAAARVRIQHREHIVDQGRVISADGLEERALRGGGPVGRIVKESLNAFGQ